MKRRRLSLHSLTALHTKPFRRFLTVYNDNALQHAIVSFPSRLLLNGPYNRYPHPKQAQDSATHTVVKEISG